MEIPIPPCTDNAPPLSPVLAPIGVTGILCLDA